LGVKQKNKKEVKIMKYSILIILLLVSVGNAERVILTPVNPKTGYSEIIPLKDVKKLPVEPLFGSKGK